MKTYDHIIIGTGQATGTLLGKLIATGDSIAVIEAAKVGGSCVNYGCTPTKTMVASARAFHLAKRGDEFGFSSDNLKLDYARVRERMNSVRNESNQGLTDWMESADNVVLIHGKAQFISDKILKVNDQEMEGKNIYINVGTRPSVPPIEGIERVSWMDSAGLLDLEYLPPHLVIIGGGYIGVEFAQIYRRFGSKVTIIQYANQLMPREDKDVADAIQEFLEEEGIEVIMNAQAESVSKDAGNIVIKAVIEGDEKIIIGSDLLIATGRIPNSDTLNLEATGMKTNQKGFIEVDDFCSTGVDGVFAVGDVNGQGAFTHTSVNDAEIVLDVLFGGNRAISKRIPIYSLFTDPPLGRVGMSEKEALNSDKKVLKAVKPMSQISRAKEMNETRGFAKLLVDADTDLILGAAILGIGGDEIINMFATIMHSQIPCREYRKVVLVHPTVSELMPFILDGIDEVRQEQSDT